MHIIRFQTSVKNKLKWLLSLFYYCPFHSSLFIYAVVLVTIWANVTRNDHKYHLSCKHRTRTIILSIFFNCLLLLIFNFFFLFVTGRGKVFVMQGMSTRQGCCFVCACLLLVGQINKLHNKHLTINHLISYHVFIIHG